MTKKKMIAKWNEFFMSQDVDERDPDEHVDPYDEEDWHSLALGFFIGLGATIPEAKKLADKVPL
jgi:hypothetical protein